MAVNVAVIKRNLVAVKGPPMAVLYARSSSEGLQGSGNTALHGTLSRQMSVLIMNPLSGLLSHW
jgi:hypothetical protein